jgi:dTDP-4-dehydrorhamnose 3,5-epimerase-like enzyme
MSGECLCARTTERIVPLFAATSASLQIRKPESASSVGLLSPRETIGETLGLMVRPTPRPDLRGQVRETYRESWFPEVPRIRQLVQSDSGPRVLRGMHLHKKQWDVWRFVKGRAWVRLYDTETDEQRFINADENVVIAIPPGISHGFYTVDGATLVYALTEEYDGSDEYGWRAFDGLANVDKDWPGPTIYGGWPTSPYGIVVSERDLTAPRLRDFAG